MKRTDYIKHYLINDLILAAVLLLTSYCWIQILGIGEDQDNEINGETVAELVPVDEITDINQNL